MVEIVYTLNVLKTVSILSIQPSMVYLNTYHEAIQGFKEKQEVLDLSFSVHTP